MLKNSHLKKGAVVDLVIDLFNVNKTIMKKGLIFDANEFIDAVIDYVGVNGTVLIRAFNWDFCQGKAFDINHTPSKVGALGNVALNRTDFTRTDHPLYSWLVWGKYKEELVKKRETDAFGSESIFAWECEKINAVQLNIGSPSVNGLTLFHYVEQKVGVKYRYRKQFTGHYIDHNGKDSIRTYSMYVRDLKYHITTDDEVYMDELIQKGIRIDGEYDGIKTQLYKIPELCDVYEKDFRKTEIPSGVTLEKV